MFKRLIALLTPAALCKHKNTVVLTSPHLGVHFPLAHVLNFYAEHENDLQRWIACGYDHYTVRVERPYCRDCKEWVGEAVTKVESVYNAKSTPWYGGQPEYTIEVPPSGIPPVEGRHVYGDLFRRLGVSLNDATYTVSESPTESSPILCKDIRMSREVCAKRPLAFLFVDHVLLEVWVKGIRYMEWEVGEPRGVLEDDALKHRARRNSR